MPNSGTWSNQFSPTMVVDDPIPAMTPLYSSLYANPHTVGTAKRPLSNSSLEFPAPKRQLLTDTHNPGHYVPVDLDSVTSDSMWNADRRVESSQSNHQSEGLPGTPMLLEARTTCPVRQEEIGLDEDAADVCATWFSKRYSVLPSDQDIEALSHLTKASTTAVRHWFGQMLKQGLAGHDSAYKSQSTLAGSQMSLEKQQASNETTEEIPQHSTEENTSEQRTRGSHQCTEGQAGRRSGKKSCTPTTNPEMLQRDESKIFQCTRKCGKRYGRKCDWKRNEEEGYPSKHWLCSLCRSRGERAKPCYRRYHFTQHFNNIHPTLSAADYETASLVETETTFPRKCGFCPKRFVNRQERIDHIADHFKKGKCMLDWNDSDESDDFNDDDDSDDSPADDNGEGSDSRSSGDKQNPENNPGSGECDDSEGNDQSDPSAGSGTDSRNSPATTLWGTSFISNNVDKDQASETQGNVEPLQSTSSQSPATYSSQSDGGWLILESPLTTPLPHSQDKQLPEFLTESPPNLENESNQQLRGRCSDQSLSLGDVKANANHSKAAFGIGRLRCDPLGQFEFPPGQFEFESRHSRTKDDSILHNPLVLQIPFCTNDQSVHISNEQKIHDLVECPLERHSSPFPVIRKDTHTFTAYRRQDHWFKGFSPHKSYMDDHFISKSPTKSARNFDKTRNTKGNRFARLLTLLNLGSGCSSSPSLDTNSLRDPDNRPVSPGSQWNKTQLDDSSMRGEDSATDRGQTEKESDIWSLGFILGMAAAWSAHGSIASDRQFDHLLGIDPRKRRRCSQNVQRDPVPGVHSGESTCKISKPRLEREGNLSTGEVVEAISSTLSFPYTDSGDPSCQSGQHPGVVKGDFSQTTHLEVVQANSDQESTGAKDFLACLAFLGKHHYPRAFMNTRCLVLAASGLNLLQDSMQSIWSRSLLASLRLLGTGGFSLVDEVLIRGTNLKICRKTLKKRDSSAFDDLVQEVEVLQQLRHPHIIRFLGTYSRGDSLSIFLSPVAEVTLSVWLDKHAVDIPPYGRDDMTKMFGCLASSVRYLHEKRPLIKHMDIKPQNILVMEGKYKFPNLVLSDFGISEISKESLSNAGSGPMTRRYCAPEVASSVSRGIEADIYSLGCVFLEMALVIHRHADLGYREFRSEFCEGKCYYNDLPRVYWWIDFLRGQDTNPNGGYILQTVKSMLNPKPTGRPDAAAVSAIFTPGPCCVAWPTGTKSFPGPLEEISSLADVLLENRDVSLQEELDLLEGANLHQHHDCLQSAIHWFQSCSTQHPACNDMGNHSSLLPTRLLDVQRTGHDESPGRLIFTTELPSNVDYVTLSYVWGNADQLMLTTNNVHSMLQSLPKEELPQAVTDAISVTRRLGVRYLWVDSLCVIQDSQEDRHRECDGMAEVYRNAVLTIVANAANNSSDPLIARSDDHSMIDWLSPGFAWDTRAWTLQERLLSKRVLHLTDKQMYWECNELKASETFPHGLPPLLWESIHCHSKQPLLQERDPAGLI